MVTTTLAQQLDTANTKLLQIGALIEMTYGNALSTFKALPLTEHDSFMWAVADLVAGAASAVDKAIAET